MEPGSIVEFFEEKRILCGVVLELKGERLRVPAHRLGAILRPLGDVIVLMPPLSISPAELEDLARITFEAIDRGTTLN